MKYRSFLLVAIFLLASCTCLQAQAGAPSTNPRPLRNGDILRLNKTGMKPGEIITRIMTSPCNFDTFPPVLHELKLKGVPDTVIAAMRMVPYGPPEAAPLVPPAPEPTAKRMQIQIPAGTPIEIEAASPISSGEAGEGAKFRFLVTRRVMVNGVLAIERGAIARAHLVKSQPASAWGRAGSLDWELDDVLAVDGSAVPLKLSDHIEGKSRSKAVVAAAIGTGAVVFPYSPPVGLIWALKKGDEAVLDRSRKSIAIVSSNSEVAGLLPLERKVIYHDVERLKASETNKSAGLPPMSNSMRATGLGRH